MAFPTIILVQMNVLHVHMAAAPDHPVSNIPFFQICQLVLKRSAVQPFRWKAQSDFLEQSICHWWQLEGHNLHLISFWSEGPYRSF